MFMNERVAIYLRVSTLDQSTELQRHEITTYINSRGWKAFQYYEDKDSGLKSSRPALNELLRDVRSRKVDIVVCWKLDRLFRSLKNLISTLQEFNELNVSFIALRDQIDMTTATGRLTMHLLGAFAEFEATLIRERVMAGLQNARRKGVKLGRPKLIDSKRVIELRRLGYSLSAISRELGVTKSGVSKTLSKLALQVPELVENQIRKK